jgi:uncharacterized protein YcbX
MRAHLAHILRHPIKSIGVEELEGALLSEGRALPLDRRWAVAHVAAKFAGQPEVWQPKANFLRGVAGPELMAITAKSSSDGITLRHYRAGEILVDLANPADRGRLIDWLTPLWPAGRPAPSHVIDAPSGGALTDISEPWLSVLSLASLRAFGQRIGKDLHINRWRGNLWIEGWAPMEEQELIGRQIRIGAAHLEVMEPITRCRATCVNPQTGVEDCDTLAALSTIYGHKDFGVYARVLNGGSISLGDTVEVI